MSMYQLTKSELREQLEEQLIFLESSIKSYSEVEFEAKRIAITVRVLVHDNDKRRGISLLKSLNRKSSLNFIDSSSPNDGRLHSMTGMVGVRGAKPNQYFGLVAKVNKDSKLIAVPLFQQHLPEWYSKYNKLDFNSWWKMEIIKINDIEVTREELIKNVADKDGGAHVDPQLPNDYHQIKTTKLILNIKGNEVEFEKNVVYISVVQIGWELLKSIKEEI